MTITSSYNEDRNIHTNIIPGYPDDMVILKGVIYEKDWPNGNKGYLTLVVMVPLIEFREYISVTKGYPNTHGVFVKCIGSMTNIVPTANRVNLNFYQHMIESAGWKFKTTAPVRGMEYESARQLAFKTIQKVKKGGDKNKTEKVSSETPQSSQFFKDVMKGHIDDIMALHNRNQDFTSSLETLTLLIDQIEAVNKERIQELIDSTLDEVMNKTCKDAEAPSCESCDHYGKCVFPTAEEKLNEVKRMLGI